MASLNVSWPPASVLQNMGSRVAPYQKHQDKDTSSSSSAAATTVYYTSISAMPTYANKSAEELRWEDYQAGVKNASSAPTPAPAAGGFGTPAAAPAAGGFGFGGASSGGAFGLGQSSPSPFGASSCKYCLGISLQLFFIVSLLVCLPACLCRIYCCWLCTVLLMLLCRHDIGQSLLHCVVSDQANSSKFITS